MKSRDSLNFGLPLVKPGTGLLESQDDPRVTGFIRRVIDDGGEITDMAAVYNAFNKISQLGLNPSLYTVAAARKAGKLYSIIPSDGSGDMSVIRSGVTAMELNQNGFWKPIGENKPRNKYTLFDLGNLIEEVATNINTYPDTLENGLYTQSGVTIDNNFGVGFSCSFLNTAGANLNLARKLNETAVTGVHRLETPQYTVSSVARNYSTSIFVKKAERNFAILVLLGDSLTNRCEATFDLNTGSISLAATQNGAFSNASASISPEADGFYRIAITGMNDSSTKIRVYLYLCTSSVRVASASYAGSSGFGIYAHHWQIISSNTITSPIYGDEGYQQTRNADTIIKSDSSTLIGQTEGTIFCEVFINNSAIPSLIRPIINIHGGTSANLIRIAINSNGISVLINASTITYLSAYVALTAGKHRMAVAYKDNDAVFYVDGVKIGESSIVIVPPCNTLEVGSQSPSGSSLKFNDTVITYSLEKTRMSNGELAILTLV